MPDEHGRDGGGKSRRGGGPAGGGRGRPGGARGRGRDGAGRGADASSRGGRPSGGRGPRGGRPRPDGRGPKGAGRGGPRRREDRPEARERRGPREHRPVEPRVPDDVDVGSLDRAVRQELRSLPKETADRVAGHLAAAGALLDTDPEAAYAHAAAAARRASRIAVVRETYGVAAYSTGRWAEAQRELRAARRMSGRDEVLPLLADCERGLGRPERALALAGSPEARALEGDARIEMLIVTAGARRDLGQPDAAVLALQVPELRARTRAEWQLRLRYAYADALLATGRESEARTWFERVAAADRDRRTDAAARLAELRGDPMPAERPADGRRDAGIVDLAADDEV